MIQVHPIPALKDNYIWAVVNPKQQAALIVDPGAAEPVLSYLKQHHLSLHGILITHHHWDHVNGTATLVAQHPAPVFVSETSTFSEATHRAYEHIPLKINAFFPEFRILTIPGHTLDHVAYYTEDAVFCGDTLFTGGCGRLFEGTAQQMYASLQKLAALAPHTRIYCGHEYTEANLGFAQKVEPNNKDLLKRIAQVKVLRERGLPSVPSTLIEEQLTNPFLRCHSTELIQQVEQQCKERLNNPVEVFRALREWKNTVS